MNKSKGFAIIELIVVIAIIAVLATIVSMTVMNYINKGKDSAIKGNLATITIKGTVYFTTNGNYTNFCNDSTVLSAINSAKLAYANPVVDSTDCASGTVGGIAVWAACSRLKSANAYFCVDYTGAKKTIATAASCISTTWNRTSCP